MKEKIFFQKNVPGHSTSPDELAQNVSKKKIPVGRIIPPFFLRKFRIWPFLNYLHDSNSIFWAQGIKSEGVFGRTVLERCTSTETETGTDSCQLLIVNIETVHKLSETKGKVEKFEPRVFADLVKSVRVHIVRLMNNLVKGLKRMMTKVQ